MMLTEIEEENLLRLVEEKFQFDKAQTEFLQAQTRFNEQTFYTLIALTIGLLFEFGVMVYIIIYRLPK